jgi:hypothetical protein
MESKILSIILANIINNSKFYFECDEFDITIFTNAINDHFNGIHNLANICNKSYDHIFNATLCFKIAINEECYFNCTCNFNAAINAKFYAKIIGLYFPSNNNFIDYNNCYADCFVTMSHFILDYNVNKLFYCQNVNKLYVTINARNVYVKNGQIFCDGNPVNIFPNIEFLAFHIDETPSIDTYIYDIGNCKNEIFTEYKSCIENEHQCEYIISMVKPHPFINLVQNKLIKNANKI